MNDEQRRTILARRRAFIAAALVGSATAIPACEPTVCLDVVSECVPTEDVYTVDASGDPCVGKIVVLRAARSSGCGDGADLSDVAVYATSDPTKLVIEGKVARGVAPGTVVVTALVDGIPRATTEVVVRECAADAGTDSAPETPTDAPSD